MNFLGKLLFRGLVAACLTASGLFAQAADHAESKDKLNKSGKYPLTTCVVSDEKLGDMGELFVFKHEGREVKLCCKPCQKEFQKNSAKYLKKLDAAEKKSKKSS